MLTAFRALLRDICSRRGVRIAKWLGDGVMLVCVDTRPLLEAILEIHHVVSEVSGPAGTVSIRSGVTSGEVILMEGDDYVGHCVNVAARLCDLAAAGEALAAPSVMDRLPSWGTIHEETQVTLRGVEKPVPASSIRMAKVDGDADQDPICGLPMTPETAEEIAHDARGRDRALLFDGVHRHLAPPPTRTGFGRGSQRLTAAPSRRRTWPRVDRELGVMAPRVRQGTSCRVGSGA